MKKVSTEEIDTGICLKNTNINKTIKQYNKIKQYKYKRIGENAKKLRDASNLLLLEPIAINFTRWFGLSSTVNQSL